jgi:VIT1/CCC1 family predicted Fe2+/Mn2+ transporter
MDKQPDPLRERLLAQFEPDREKLATHRKEVQAMLETNEQTLRLQQRIAKSMGLGTCFFLMGIGLITLGGLIADKPFLVLPAPVWAFAVCFTLIGASFEILKYFIARSRVEVLKEVKGLELQLLEIKEHLQHRQA